MKHFSRGLICSKTSFFWRVISSVSLLVTSYTTSIYAAIILLKLATFFDTGNQIRILGICIIFKFNTSILNTFDIFVLKTKRKALTPLLPKFWLSFLWKLAYFFNLYKTLTLHKPAISTMLSKIGQGFKKYHLYKKCVL